MPKSTLNEIPILSNSQFRQKNRLEKKSQELADDNSKNKSVKQRLMQEINEQIWHVCMPDLYK